MAEIEPTRRRVASSVAAAAAGARSWASCSSTASPRPSPCARANPPCCPSCSRRCDARKLLIYSDHGAQNPMNAAEITNSTGKTLDGGPITVYDGGAYGGEALMETLKAGDKRLISYAVDLGTRITTRFDSQARHGARNSRPPRRAHHPLGGARRPAPTPSATWTRRPRRCIIEHPARPEYTLLNRKPAETTAERLPLRSEAGAGRHREVPGDRGARLRNQRDAWRTSRPTCCCTYVQNKKLSEAARKQLEEIAARKRQIAERRRRRPAAADAKPPI